MKKLASLVLLCFITLTVNAQRVVHDFTPLTEELDYKVKWFSSLKTTSDSQYNYIAGKGLTYQSIVMEIKNNTDEEVKIDFTRLAIIDKNNKKYEAHIALQSGKMIFSDRLTRNLGAGKTRTFIVEFWPAFPKGETPRLLIEDQVVELELKK